MIFRCHICGKIKKHGKWVSIAIEQLAPHGDVEIRDVICEDCIDWSSPCKRLKSMGLHFHTWCVVFTIFAVMTVVGFGFVFGFCLTK